MMKAYELGMTKGEYVFYTIEMLPEENVLNPEDVWANDDGQNVVAKEAFEAVFHVRHIKKSYHIRYVIGIEPNENLSVWVFLCQTWSLIYCWQCWQGPLGGLENIVRLEKIEEQQNIRLSSTVPGIVISPYIFWNLQQFISWTVDKCGVTVPAHYYEGPLFRRSAIRVRVRFMVRVRVRIAYDWNSGPTE